MLLQRPKRAIINTKLAILLLLIVLVITTSLVFTLGHKSIFAELTITLSLISFCLFIFTTTGLYFGFKIQKEKNQTVQNNVENNISNVDASDAAIHAPDLATMDFDFPDDPIGAIIAIISWILISIGVVFLLANFFSFIFSGIVSLAVMIYWIFYKALRRIFTKSKKCMLNIKMSILYGLYYTALYTGWIYLIILVSKSFNRNI